MSDSTDTNIDHEDDSLNEGVHEMIDHLEHGAAARPRTTSTAMA